jgi:DNA-binding CsgD family transcriptional regulator
MTESEQLSELIGEIYDAALDPSLWPDILFNIADFVGGKAAGLLSKDSVSKVGNAYYQFGVDDHYLRLYEETFWRFDPLTPLLFFAVEQVTATSDVMPYPEFAETRFYREWVQPQGWIDAANVVLEKSVTSCAILSVIRSERQGIVDDEMRRRMQLVVPHVRRAVLIGRIIDLKTNEAATLTEALDALSAAMFLVDASGRIVHANAAAHAMLAAGDFLHAGGGRLIATDAEANRTLRDVFTAAELGDTAVGTSGISVPLIARDGEQLVAHTLPLTSGARRVTGSSYKAAAALFVHKASLDTASPPELIARTYKLTPTELRILLAIVQVGGVPDVSEALGVAENTVKTHLKRLYAKTGASRQADLVKLMAKFSSPLVGGA